jgi:hypothetical protein
MPLLYAMRSLACFVHAVQELIENPIHDHCVVYLQIKLHPLIGKAAARDLTQPGSIQNPRFFMISNTFQASKKSSFARHTAFLPYGNYANL